MDWATVETVVQESIKALGAIASAGFGFYALVSEKTHDENGDLNKSGRTARAGLIVALVVSVSLQTLDAVQRFNQVESDKLKNEELLRAALYLPFSTKDARADLSFSVDLDDLKRVDPDYAALLEKAYASPHAPGCKEVLIERMASESWKRWDCNGYSIEDDTLGDPIMRFDHSSALSPLSDQFKFKFAQRLIADQGFFLQLVEKQGDKNISHSRERDSTLLILLSQFVPSPRPTDPAHAELAETESPSTPRFEFNGRSLSITVSNALLDPKALPGINVTSMIDLLGKKLVLDPSLELLKCPEQGQAGQCAALKDVLAKGLTFQRFALTFPHRKDLVFNMSDPGSVAKKKEVNPVRTTLVYSVPQQVSDLPPTDRRDPNPR
jgi:hypothetical protein